MILGRGHKLQLVVHVFHALLGPAWRYAVDAIHVRVVPALGPEVREHMRTIVAAEYGWAAVRQLGGLVEEETPRRYLDGGVAAREVGPLLVERSLVR